LDILFTEPKADPGEDQELARAIKEAGNVILGAELADVPSDFGPKTTLSKLILSIRFWAASAAIFYGAVSRHPGLYGYRRTNRPGTGRCFPQPILR